MTALDYSPNRAAATPRPDDGSGRRLVLRDVRAVLRDRIIDDATVVCENGVIVDVVAGSRSEPGSVSGHGALCLPGLVDTHSDGLEKELRPRPTSRFPHEFALRNFEGRLRSAGITTVFHGVGFEEREEYGRTIEQADASCDVLAERRATAGVPVDHRVLYRMEARSHRGLPEAEAHFAAEDLDDGGAGILPLVSFEDHSPGQGQFRDVAKYAASIPDDKVPDGMTRDAFVDARIAAAEEAIHHRETKLDGLVAHARAGRIRLLAHDCEDPGQVATAHTEWGASVAEFPLTLDAARRARELGMATVMGAPNVILGGSHSGNVAAEETVRAGVCSGLASDYLPASLLAAAFLLAERGATDLPGAVALVTAGPASVAGLDDRGQIEAGRRADLLLVVPDGRWPRVASMWRAGVPV
jgi:alpha-D-ribose 1-methylphosphonate 5-triphosphate diphosphatase